MKNIMDWWQALEWNTTLEIIIIGVLLLIGVIYLLFIMFLFAMDTLPSSSVQQKKELRKLYIKPNAAKKRKIFHR